MEEKETVGNDLYIAFGRRVGFPFLLVYGLVQGGRNRVCGLGMASGHVVWEDRLLMVYCRIVIASLQPQLYILLKDTNLCGSADSTYWAGIVESVFALGSVAGLYWGCLSDRVGRRPVALIGLMGMCMAALIMGFSTSALACAIVRFFGGFMASSLRTMVWTMLGDVSRSSKSKASNFSRLPLVSIGGLLGPIMQAALAHRFGKSGDLWKMFPILGSQLACAGLLFLVLIANFLFLEEV
jgi:MFS family permease